MPLSSLKTEEPSEYSSCGSAPRPGLHFERAGSPPFPNRPPLRRTLFAAFSCPSVDKCVCVCEWRAGQRLCKVTVVRMGERSTGRERVPPRSTQQWLSSAQASAGGEHTQWQSPYFRPHTLQTDRSEQAHYRWFKMSLKQKSTSRRCLTDEALRRPQQPRLNPDSCSLADVGMSLFTVFSALLYGIQTV